ncbi:MAG: G8 domain-containing protein, partial [Paludibacter sp.]
MQKITFSIIPVALIAILILTSSVLHAATITYAAVTGNWTDANWTPQAPVAGDHVVIPAGAVVTVNSDLSSTKLNSISVLGTLTIETGGV